MHALESAPLVRRGFLEMITEFWSMNEIVAGRRLMSTKEACSSRQQGPHTRVWMRVSAFGFLKIHMS